MLSAQKADLTLRHNTLDPKENAALAALLRDVLGVPGRREASTPWVAFALFDAAGRCAAGLEAAILPLVLDGEADTAAAIRSVAVDPAWRGRGLFRRLMVEALAWCDARASGPALLYTEEPALYGRFGFRALAQHRFVGGAPRPKAGPPGRRLDMEAVVDRDLIRSLVARRACLSSQVALSVDATLVLDHLAEDPWRLALMQAPEAVIVYDEDPDGIVIADVIGPALPDLATILGALPVRAPRVTVLFPPDRIGWRGVPEPEDAGLMIRGDTPAAMRRPFMIPPTAEF